MTRRPAQTRTTEASARAGKVRFARAAMACITAAVVGVILNLAVWFAVHTVFGVVDSVPIGPFSLQVPQWHTVSWFSAAIAAGAIVAVFGFRMPMFLTLGLGVAAGVVAKIAGG